MLYRRARHKVLFGGRASAKSWGAFEAAIYYAVTYKVRILCLRELQASIKDSSHKLIKDTIERLGVLDQFEVTRDEIRCISTGSLFIFKGVDRNPDSLRSIEKIDICICEESQCFSQASIDALIPSIRAYNSEIWWLFNPRLPSDPVSMMFQNGTLPPGTLIQKMNYYDNKYLPEVLKDEIAFCRVHTPEAYLHIWEGHFAQESDELFIPLKKVVEAQRRDIVRDISKPIVAGLDVARSLTGDKSVLVFRRGNEVLAKYKWQLDDLVKLQEAVVPKLLLHNASVVVVDGGGLGGGVVDHLRRAIHIKVLDFKGHIPANNTYLNQRALTWGLMKDWLSTTGCISANDRDLEGQLSTIKYLVNSKGKIQLEKKSDMKKRGIDSPDDADALSMTFYKIEEHGRALQQVGDYMSQGPDQWQG